MADDQAPGDRLPLSRQRTDTKERGRSLILMSAPTIAGPAVVVDWSRPGAMGAAIVGRHTGLRAGDKAALRVAPRGPDKRSEAPTDHADLARSSAPRYNGYGSRPRWAGPPER